MVARQDALGSPWRARVGVALAAIQGLHQMMQQKDAKLQQQSREISALKRKLQVIGAKGVVRREAGHRALERPFLGRFQPVEERGF